MGAYVSDLTPVDDHYFMIIDFQDVDYEDGTGILLNILQMLPQVQNGGKMMRTIVE